jgi:hypothetical protein
VIKIENNQDITGIKMASKNYEAPPAYRSQAPKEWKIQTYVGTLTLTQANGHILFRETYEKAQEDLSHRWSPQKNGRNGKIKRAKIWYKQWTVGGDKNGLLEFLSPDVSRSVQCPVSSAFSCDAGPGLPCPPNISDKIVIDFLTEANVPYEVEW